MARQFLIGELGSTSYTSGKLADTGLNIEALSVANDEGPISWAIDDPVPDMIRFVQGTTSGPNVYSNWINPRNIIVADGSAADNSTHHECDMEIVGESTLVSGGSASNMKLDLKFCWHNPDGADEFYHCSLDIGATAADPTIVAATQDTNIQSSYEALTDKPNWLHTDCSTSGDVAAAATGADTPTTPGNNYTVTFMGNVPGATTTDSGDAFEAKDAARISVYVVSQNDIGTTTYTITQDVVRGYNGVGTYYSTKAFEDKMKGIMYGYYNRVQLPNTPDNGVEVGSTYDFITIVATKDGSAASGQIHGVDNLDEIFIAGKAGVATWSETEDTCFIDKLNGILAVTNPTLPGVSV